MAPPFIDWFLLYTFCDWVLVFVVSLLCLLMSVWLVLKNLDVLNSYILFGSAEVTFLSLKHVCFYRGLLIFLGACITLHPKRRKCSTYYSVAPYEAAYNLFPLDKKKIQWTAEPSPRFYRVSAGIAAKKATCISRGLTTEVF